MNDIALNLARVLDRMTAAANRAGRNPAEVTLLPITKTVPAVRLREAMTAGLTRFGENRVQEAQTKATALHDLDVQWTLVGHLQTNKARAMVAFVSEFQALDSPRLADALHSALSDSGRTLDVYLQVNTSGESTKFGLTPDDLAAFVRHIEPYDTLRIRGLMTLAAFTPDQDIVRACFRRLRLLARQTEQTLGRSMELSMGMSGDFETAIEEGATVIRVGQAIFGERATSDAEYWPGIG